MVGQGVTALAEKEVDDGRVEELLPQWCDQGLVSEQDVTDLGVDAPKVHEIPVCQKAMKYLLVYSVDGVDVAQEMEKRFKQASR